MIQTLSLVALVGGGGFALGAFAHALAQLAVIIRHWHGLVQSISNPYAPILGPLILINPNANLTPEGLMHYQKLKPAFAKFALSLLPIAVIGIVTNVLERTTT